MVAHLDVDSGPAATGSPPAAFLLNLTGGRIDVLGQGRSVVLAPLRRLPLSTAQLCAFDASVLRDSDLVRLERPEVPPARAPLAVYGVLAGLAVTSLAVAALLGAVEVGVVLAAGVAVLGLLLWAGWTLATLIDGRRPSVRASTRWLGEKASQLMVFVIGFGFALAAALVANGGLDDSGLTTDQGALFRIGLQTLFLGLAITFPAFLYYAFDRQRAAALRTRFLADAFRLDDHLATVGEVEARYGDRMKDAFGSAGGRLASDDRVRSGRRRSPVVVATLVLSLALVVAFVDVGATGRDGPLLVLFTPTAAILPFAFLGAYLFAVLTSLRSYLRGDLLPKAYSQIAARMLVVVTLAAVLGALSQAIAPSATDQPSYSAWLLALAFFAGLVPNTALQFLSESTRRVFPLWGGARMSEPQPLTMIEGIDLYDRARLEQEGVTTIGGLVYGDLIDLMIQTRIPTGRLVDWLDQAVLQIYTGTDADAPDNQTPAAARAAWASAVRACGVRTASDLLAARPTDPPLDSLAALLADEPVMRRIHTWRRNVHPEPRVLDARPRRAAALSRPDLDLAGPPQPAVLPRPDPAPRR